MYQTAEWSALISSPLNMLGAKIECECYEKATKESKGISYVFFLLACVSTFKVPSIYAMSLVTKLIPNEFQDLQIPQ